jgi:tRNA A-37 threonylcarbamoyl transferase component Bud32
MENNNRKLIASGDGKDFYLEDDRCIKLFDESKSKADVLNEALNHAWVEETGLSVPSLLEVRVIDGRWALVTDFIDGKTLKELLEEEPEKEDEYLKLFVDLQVDMQSKRCPYLRRHRDKMNAKISQTDLSATLRYDLHNRIESMPKYSHLCHGDYNPSNVLISKDGKAYIIDWSHATQGNPEADAARTFMMFLVEGKKERAKKYLKCYSEASGCDIKEVLGWLPILAASQSVKNIRKQTGFLKSVIFMDEKQLEALYE